MKDNKSPGADGILPKLFKEIVERISTPLAKVFSLLKEGTVQIEHYKPVSLISDV